MCHKVIVGNESLEGTVLMQVITIGIDLAKNVFHMHGVDANDKVVFNKPLRRSQVLPFFAKLAPCLIGMEACASVHYWARELKKLGHNVRLPAKDVMAYVKRGKNDAIYAAACCEAVRRPSPGLAGELIALRHDAIVSGTTAGILAVKQATATIPIRGPGMTDPEGFGLIASIARPGGQVTGILLAREAAAARPRSAASRLQDRPAVKCPQLTARFLPTEC